METIEEDSREMGVVRGSIESCFQHTPVVVLGSGASAAHGIHTMDSLAEKIIENIEDDGLLESFESDWGLFKKSLKETSNLERALEVIENNKGLTEKIALTTWKLISSQDQSVFNLLVNDETSLPLSTLIKRLSNGLGPTSNLKIVTTNYDRLAEYACDFIDDQFNEYLHYTGFSYGFIRKPDDTFYQSPQNVGRRALGRRREDISLRINPVEILKVHGSIDWFENNREEIFSIPYLNFESEQKRPAIVIPGKTKYEKTHVHPYSTIITRARQILDHSNSYMVIGFGFRDKHIHDNLSKKVRSDRGHKNFVVLAKELTDETKDLFFSGNHSGNYVLLEQAPRNSGTIIYHKDSRGQMFTYNFLDKNLWSLSEFNEFFLKDK